MAAPLTKSGHGHPISEVSTHGLQFAGGRAIGKLADLKVDTCFALLVFNDIYHI